MPATFNERPHQNEKAEALTYVRYLMEQARKESNHEELPKLEKLIGLIDSKRYGLVWEEHAELVEEEMKIKIPVFIEDEIRKIHGNPDSTDYNFLLEGDNLHSLHLLKKTHAGKIDVIYIDPPYNTGNKDFVYNDKIVDKTDGYSHSKWLSFMSKRLELARELLSETGIIFISIDDNEQAQLKLLCDEIFGKDNFVAELPTIMNLKGNQDEFGFAGTHEYTIVFSKNKSLSRIREFPITEEADKQGWEKDDLGYFKQGANLKATGINAPRSKRPNLFFPIYIGKNTWSLKYFNGATEIFPITNGKEMSWRWSREKFLKEPYNIIIKKNSNSISIYKKQRPKIGDVPTIKPKSIFYKPEYSSGNGTKQIKEIFGSKIFNNPKPIELIKDFIQLSSNETSTILDFFAGSGTTGHAVAQLNKEDGGNRKYILCTNNENNICEEVTYKRLSNIQEELPHNLKYFKTQFIDKDDEDLEYALLNNVKTLIELEHAIDLKESDKTVAFTLSEIRNLDLTGIKTVYVRQHSHALMEKEDRLRYEGVELVDVPEYYFAKEMSEAGL
ncbi:site-specific DNA-methyltransferase [Streptococcus ferus]|uniref:site-specific DNA-methyltransferase n=1 Tax=Streptococcus ferus TaxID=1345 RepID=UPI00359FD6F7